eukprot:12936713-Alexandrium_andersonii.AAC.1
MTEVEKLKATNGDNHRILFRPSEDLHIGHRSASHESGAACAGYSHDPAQTTHVLRFQPAK